MRSRLHRLFPLGKGLGLLTQLAAVLLLVFWLLVGLATATFHWVIVPRAADWRDDLAQVLSQSLGAPVELDRLSAATIDGVPTLQLGGLRVRDPQGEVALEVADAQASLSARSLLNLGFEHVRLRGVNVQVTRDAQGLWRVGGVALPSETQAGPSWAMNWLFQQSRARIDGAHVVWRDAWWAAQQGMAQTPQLQWHDVQLVLRNDGRRHRWRIDASPSLAPHQVWTLRGDVRSPTLSRAVGDWQQWSGQVFAHAAGVDLALLNRYVDARRWLGVESASGQGDWRAWVDVQRGAVLGVTNDWALQDVQARLRADLKPLALAHLNGRLTFFRPQQGWRVETHGLQFETADGLRWPGGDVQWRWQAGGKQGPEQSQLTATDMDLAAMSAVALRLPLPESVLKPWQDLQPKGRVDSVQLNWQGPLDAPKHFQAKGAIRGLAWRPGGLPSDARRGELARPGVQGLDVQFEANEQGGQAQLAMKGGWWWLPGVWDDPELAVSSLRSRVAWSQVRGAWQVRARDVAFANADVSTQGDVTWTDGPRSGQLDLRLKAERANLARLARYLPRVSAPSARRYVDLAIQAGTGRDVDVRIQGAVDDVPYVKPNSGVFQITGRVEGVRFDVAPKVLVGKTWMRLSDFSGRYQQDNTRLRLEGVRAKWNGQDAIRITEGEAEIRDLMTAPQLRAQAQASGPLKSWLAGVEATALRPLMGGVLDGVQARGQGSLHLDLSMALVGKDDPKVSGHFDVSQAQIQWSPDLPVATGAQGRVDFDGQGVRVKAQAAQALGGDAQIGVQVDPRGDWQAQVQGRYTVAALRQWGLLRDAQPWLSQASGASNYRMQLRRTRGQELTWDLRAGLKGVALSLPAPMAKSAEADWQLHWQTSGLSTRLRVGPSDVPVLRAELRRSSPQWAGVVVVGPSPQTLPPVNAHTRGLDWWLSLPKLDVDAWQTALETLLVAEPAAANQSSVPVAASTPAWWPSRVHAQVGALQLGGWDFADVRMDAQADVPGWRADVQAKEFAGWLRFEPATAQTPQGRVVARLKRLRLTPSAVSQVETALTAQPRELPALDVEVQDLVLKGRDWGKVSLRARNEVVTRGQRRLAQWRLEHLGVEVPEATLSAQGLWAPVDADLMAAAQGLWRRTALDVQLDVRDSGALLTRFDMPGVIKGGAGKLSGQLSWQGSPLNFDKKSLGGYLHLDVGQGQFLKADPGIAKLLGVLSLQSLPRRLLLDFRDVFNAGFAFDSIQGRAQIDSGVLFTRDLTMRGPAAVVLIEGHANVLKESQDLQVLVLPQLDAGTLSLWAGLANPVVGLATYVAQKLFGKAVANANVRAMHVSGSWQDPKVDNIRTGQQQEPAPVRTSEPQPLASALPQTPVTPPRQTPVLKPAGELGALEAPALKPISPARAR